MDKNLLEIDGISEKDYDEKLRLAAELKEACERNYAALWRIFKG